MRAPTVQVSRALDIDRGTLRELLRRLRRAAARLGVGQAELEGLHLRLVDDLEMAELHQRFLGLPGPTDVLAFSGGTAGLGDLAIDWQAVARQASDRSPRGLLDEATVLAVHGLTHLLGHDHANRVEGRRMHRDETRALRALAVGDRPRPYAPRLLAPRGRS